MNKYKNIAVDIVNTIGKDNIASATHCATRLRLQVKDREAIDDEKIRQIGEVKGVFYNSGQYQIILGTVSSTKFTRPLWKSSRWPKSAKTR
nr:PTS system protein [Raoultella sp. NCTC 9187]